MVLYKIRGEQESDILAIKEVNDLAFGQGNKARLIDETRGTKNFVPQLSLVGETDTGEIIGHILFSLVTIKTQNGTVQSLALAPMAVKPQYQQQGIGPTWLDKV